MGEHLTLIAVALIAATPGTLAYFNQRKRMKAEAGEARVRLKVEAEAERAKLEVKAERVRSSNAARVTEAIWEISEEYKCRVKTLEEKIKKLETELKETSGEVARLLSGVRILLKQLIRHEIEPDWSPDKQG